MNDGSASNQWLPAYRTLISLCIQKRFLLCLKPVTRAFLVFRSADDGAVLLIFLKGMRIKASHFKYRFRDRAYTVIPFENMDMRLFLVFKCRGKPSFSLLPVIKPGFTVPFPVTSCTAVLPLIVMTLCLILQQIILRTDKLVFSGTHRNTDMFITGIHLEFDRLYVMLGITGQFDREGLMSVNDGIALFQELSCSSEVRRHKSCAVIRNYKYCIHGLMPPSCYCGNTAALTRFLIPLRVTVSALCRAGPHRQY